MAARTSLILLALAATVALAGGVGWWQFGRDAAPPSRVEVGTAQSFDFGPLRHG